MSPRRRTVWDSLRPSETHDPIDGLRSIATNLRISGDELLARALDDIEERLTDPAIEQLSFGELVSAIQQAARKRKKSASRKLAKKRAVAVVPPAPASSLRLRGAA